MKQQSRVPLLTEEERLDVPRIVPTSTRLEAAAFG